MQKDFYKLPVRVDEFEKYADRVKATLCYNGDIFSPADCADICARFPKVEAVMLGRGLIRNPALISIIKGGSMPDKSVFRAFHDDLYAVFKEKKWSDNAILCHMKEIWAYMDTLFVDSEKPIKALRKAKRLSDYSDAVKDIFAHDLNEM